MVPAAKDFRQFKDKILSMRLSSSSELMFFSRISRLGGQEIKC